MNKTELINAAAEAAGLSKKDTEAALKAIVDATINAVKAGDSVQLIGFGTFSLKERAARTGINPKTKEKIEIKAAKAPAFKAGKAFKDAVNTPAKKKACKKKK